MSKLNPQASAWKPERFSFVEKQPTEEENKISAPENEQVLDDEVFEECFEESNVVDPAEFDPLEGAVINPKYNIQENPINMLPSYEPYVKPYSNAASSSSAGSVSMMQPGPAAALSGNTSTLNEDPVNYYAIQQKQIESQLEERNRREEHIAKHGNTGKKTALNAPVTVNGKHRWPKPSTAAKKLEQSQKAALESFANAILNTISPFMAPLRKLTRTSLPHIKFDQRFGKRGHPESAIMQFIVSPVVVNYKPTHFHEISPGDLLEFHHDFALILKQLPTANCISINYGKLWKPFALPYLFLGCREYTEEVKRLCPDEIPNSRCEAVYEDDLVKDITSVICSVKELEVLNKMSIIDAMKNRVNLVTMYDVFNQLFAPIGDYQIQIRKLNDVPSLFLLKTSLQILDKNFPKKNEDNNFPSKHSDDNTSVFDVSSHKIVLNNDESLWDDLPTVPNTFQSGKTIVVPAPILGEFPQTLAQNKTIEKNREKSPCQNQPESIEGNSMNHILSLKNLFVLASCLGIVSFSLYYFEKRSKK